MMTVKQHDNAWLDVMTKQVPHGVHYLAQIAGASTVDANLKIIDRMLEHGMITEEEYKIELQAVADYVGFKLERDK